MLVFGSSSTGCPPPSSGTQLGPSPARPTIIRDPLRCLPLGAPNRQLLGLTCILQISNTSNITL